MRSLKLAVAALVVTIFAVPSRASLTCPGVWDAGVWDSTVWDAGVWDETCVAGSGDGRISIFLGIRI